MIPLLPFSLALLLLPNLALAEPPIRPGDRIAIVGNTFADQLRIHGYLETLLLQHTDSGPISLRNLGWGGDMLTARDRPTNFPTEESTLQAHQTDVIIACFGMGESFAGPEGLEDFKDDLRAFLNSHQGKSYNGTSEVRLILISPIAYESLGDLTPRHKERNAALEAYTLAMSEVAGESSIPFVGLFAATRYLAEEWNEGNFTTNGIHLDETGYWTVSRLIYDHLVGKPSSPWRIEIDAKSLNGTASGGSISELIQKEDSVQFLLTEASPPSLAPPTDLPLPPQLEAKRDLLTVAHLDPGSYTLTVNGNFVVTADHLEWANGIPIDASPAHQEAEALRAAIQEKNLQFTYSWKALNQVHIVGERRNSPSGRALPAEVIEFNRLANELDQTLSTKVSPKSRTWRLTSARQ
ncbi:MAG: SGNH/GDSL hydrolase family protein [Verrucomicrobiota bacterium]